MGRDKQMEQYRLILKHYSTALSPSRCEIDRYMYSQKIDN